MRRVPAIALLFLSLALLAGCGTDASERDVTATVERFQAALAVDDGRRPAPS